MKRKNDAESDGLKSLKESKDGDAACSFHYSDNKESLYRPPTSEEINSLKETENLFQSSLLRMQINELLSEVALKKKKKKLEETLHSLNELLMSLPDGNEQDMSDVSWLPDKIHIPLPPLPGPIKGKFKFMKPESVNVVGSYLLGTLCKPLLNIDIAVQIPQECIHAKDYLNLRYHYKRGLYLAIIASHIKKSKLFKQVEFSLHNGDLWKPILVLKPKGKIEGKFVIKMFITLPAKTFKLSRLLPQVNNVRKHWFFAQQVETQSKQLPQEDPGSPTPHYNSSILIDMLLEQHLHLLYNNISKHQSLIDAVVLCKVWLDQRQLNKGFQGFTGFHVSMVMAYLLQSHQVSQHMSSYQVLRIFWQFLASKDLTSVGVSMLDQKSFVDDHMPSLTHFHDAFEVVFVDSSGYLNLFASMTKMTFKQLSQEAKLALDILDSHSVNGFDSLFMKTIPFITRFDNFFCLKDVGVFKTVLENLHLDSELADRAGDTAKLGLSWLEKLLTKALGNRIQLLALKPETFPKWPLKEKPPLTSQHSATVGILLNTDNATNVLEKGPSADHVEAKNFREFWGEKSELRRFQDGSISEAVVWTCNNVSEKRKICEQIIKHVLNRHGAIDPSQIVFISNELESILEQHVVSKSKNKKKDNVFESGTGEEAIQTVIRTFESLGKQLRSLPLPLSINSIQGLSPVLRGTEVFPPVPCFHSAHDTQHNIKKDITIPVESKKAPTWCPVSEVVIQFETSGQWPDDIDAIQRIKAAFLLNIANLLRKECQLPAVANTKYIDVIKDGFAFRIKLGHYREMILFQQSTGIGSLKQLHEANAKNLEKEMVHLPLLSSMIHGIQQQYSSFGSSVRLAKRWMSSHMLMTFFCQECIELITAYLFLTPSPFTTPGSPVVAFLRFLLLLSTFDWNNNPLIVNLNNELTALDYQAIQSHFTSNRAQLPAMVIATPKDKHFSYWTKDNPSLLILKRASLLAKESFAVLHNQLIQSNIDSTDLKQIFRPPMEDYDITISLHTKFNPRFYQVIDSTKVVSYQPKSSSDMILPVVNFDPVQLYLNELKESFSDIAMFFHDVYGGNIIGIVWKPTAFEPAQFKVLHSQYCIPSDQDENLMVPNIHAILSDFEILGEGLVKDIKIANLPV